MQKLVFLLLMVLSVSFVNAQKVNPVYDSILSKKLGADEYGMKSYVFVILKTGSNTTAEKAVRDSLFAGHMENIGRLVKLNKLLVAGPFGKNDKAYRGLFILNVTTLEEASELLQTDPAIREKLLEPELYKWYGSAALSEYLDAADKIWRNQP